MNIDDKMLDLLDVNLEDETLSYQLIKEVLLSTDENSYVQEKEALVQSMINVFKCSTRDYNYIKD